MIVIGVVIVLLIIPFQVVHAPEWEVLVVDSFGKPVSGVTVRESYKDYSSSQSGGEQDLITNENGKVIFPKKIESISGFGRLGGVASSLAEGVHASFGRHAFVFAFGKCEGDSVKNGYVEDWTGYPSHNSSTIICNKKGKLIGQQSEDY
jgi:hypothetical protein